MVRKILWTLNSKIKSEFHPCETNSTIGGCLDGSLRPSLIWYLFCRPSVTIRSPPKSEHSIYWSCVASVGIRVYRRHILPKRAFWRLDLATGLSREFKLRANGLANLGLLSCSEQLARHFSFWHAWHVCFNLAACSREPPARSSRESLLLCTHLSNSSYSLTHTTLTWFPPKYRVSNC